MWIQYQTSDGWPMKWAQIVRIADALAMDYQEAIRETRGMSYVEFLSLVAIATNERKEVKQCP